MRIEAADHPAAAMDEQHRARRAGGAIEAHRDVSAVGREGEIVDLRDGLDLALQRTEPLLGTDAFDGRGQGVEIDGREGIDRFQHRAQFGQ